MPELVVNCPSGLRGTVRGFKTKEANLLANRKEIRKGTSFDKVLSACWLETTEPGPYAGSTGQFDWGKALTCDRFWALMCIRAATFGDAYTFNVPCQDRRDCGSKIEWECNLSELPFQDLPEESRDKIAAGDNRFEHTLEVGEYAGRKVFFRLQTGDGERKGARMVRGQDTRLVVASLATRIIEIEGVDKGGLVRFLDDMELGDLMSMMDTFDDSDGGVETLIEIQCGECGLLQDVNLPLGQDFFMPRKRKGKTSVLDRL